MPMVKDRRKKRKIIKNTLLIQIDMSSNIQLGNLTWNSFPIYWISNDNKRYFIWLNLEKENKSTSTIKTIISTSLFEKDWYCEWICELVKTYKECEKNKKYSRNDYEIKWWKHNSIIHHLRLQLKEGKLLIKNNNKQ